MKRTILVPIARISANESQDFARVPIRVGDPASVTRDGFFFASNEPTPFAPIS